jgi:cell division initiation protein
MIDLTPLDVRKKRGDFAKSLRGYEPREVDHFLEMVADRLEAVVKQNLAFRDQVERLQDKVQGQEGRESAVQNALVTAQELRKDIEDQAQREAELIRREARMEAEGIRAEAAAAADQLRRELLELNRTRERFLRSVRTMLERQLEALEVEEGAPRVKGFDLDALREAVAQEDVRARRAAGPAPDIAPATPFEPAPDDGAEGPTPLDSLLEEGAQTGPGGAVQEEEDLFSPAAEPGDAGGAAPDGGAPRTGEGR